MILYIIKVNIDIIVNSYIICCITIIIINNKMTINNNVKKIKKIFFDIFDLYC